MRLTICLSLLLLLTPLPSGAQSSTDQQAPQAGPTPTTTTDLTTAIAAGSSDSPFPSVTDPNYILGPEDVLDIEVFNVPELKETIRVAADGQVALPLIGRVQATGLTTDQFRQELADKWGESYLQDPQVSVFVKEFKARPVSVIGAVEKPDLYFLKGPHTLIEVLSMAGGSGKHSGAGRTVVITRKSGFKDLQIVQRNARAWARPN